MIIHIIQTSSQKLKQRWNSSKKNGAAIRTKEK